MSQSIGNLLLSQEIISGEYVIKDISAGTNDSLYTKNLGAEIAFSFYSPQAKKSGMARSLDEGAITKFLQELNIASQAKGSIKMRIFGGIDDDATEIKLEKLLDKVLEVDKNEVIDIVSCDTGARIHPDSVILSCRSGNVTEYNELVSQQVSFTEMLNKQLQQQQSNQK